MLKYFRIDGSGSINTNKTGSLCEFITGSFFELILAFN